MSKYSNQSYNNILSFNFPILPNKFLKWFKQSKIQMLHYTSKRGLEYLHNLQNTNKAICVTNIISYTALDSGIGTQGGVVVLVSGYPIAYFDFDAYSSKDQKGVRWINFDILKNKAMSSSTNKTIINKINFLEQQYNKVIDKLIIDLFKEMQPEREIDVYNDYDWYYIKNKGSQFVDKFVNTFYKSVYPKFLNKYAKDLQYVFRYVKTRVKSFSSKNKINENINQIILVKTKILDVAIAKWLSQSPFLPVVSDLYPNYTVVNNQQELIKFARKNIKQNKTILQMPHVQYDTKQSKVKQLQNKMIDLRLQRFVDKEQYKKLYNSFKNGDGVVAKLKNQKAFYIFKDNSVEKSTTDKGLPHLPDEWYKYIIILDIM